MYYKIYCDGSANLQKQKGGIGILIILCNDDNLEISATEYSEGFDNVTNNQMELMAVTKALQYINNKTIRVELITDSEYTTKGLTEWWPKWQLNGKNYKNKELWDKLMEEYVKFPLITITHTKGHKKGKQEHVLGNNVVDKLASYKNFSDNENN